RQIREKSILRGLQAAHKHITIVRAALDFAASKKLMLPADYGDDFDTPSQSEINKDRIGRDNSTGERAWTENELREMIVQAKARGGERKTSRNNKIKENKHLYAQILLGLFGG